MFLLIFLISIFVAGNETSFCKKWVNLGKKKKKMLVKNIGFYFLLCVSNIVRGRKIRVACEQFLNVNQNMS